MSHNDFDDSDYDDFWEHPEQVDGEHYFGNIYPDWESTEKRLKASPVPVRMGFIAFGFNTHEPLDVIGLRPLFCRMEDYEDLWAHFNEGVEL